MSQSAISVERKHPEYLLRRDAASFLFSLCITVVAGLLGYVFAPLITPRGYALSLLSSQTYIDCETAADAALRFSVLFRPMLMHTVLVWLSAYVQFEKVLSGFVFAARGLSLGFALHILCLAKDAVQFAPLAVAYTAVTVILLLLMRWIRKDSGARPATESFVFTLIAAGAAACISLVVSIMYNIDF